MNKPSAGETTDNVISRFPALLLAFIIGGPACWCCAQPVPGANNVEHSCCEQSMPAAPDQNDACPCGASMIKRELAKATIDVPQPNLLVTALVPVSEPGAEAASAVTQTVVHFYDTGPPHDRLPVYLRLHALLI